MSSLLPTRCSPGGMRAGNSSSFLDDGSVGSPMVGSGASPMRRPPGSANVWRARPAKDNVKGHKMDNVTTRITTDKQTSGYWRVPLSHPPINTIDDQMYDEDFDLVEAIEAEPPLKVATFESANPDVFHAHYGVVQATRRFGKPSCV